MPTELAVRRGMTANQLKLIAILAMTIDHFTWILRPGYSRELPILILHAIGRLAAPIMWFFIAEGYHHTRSKLRYASRLFLLALVSHFAYNFCFGISFVPLRDSVFNQTSVAWPLAWGLVLLCINDACSIHDCLKPVLTLLVCAVTFPSDWSCIASLAVLFIGANHGNFKKQMLWMLFFTAMYALVYFVFLDRTYGILQFFTCLAIPFLMHYNGKRGSWRGMGKLFYIYYPAHLVLCGLIRIYLQ